GAAVLTLFLLDVGEPRDAPASLGDPRLKLRIRALPESDKLVVMERGLRDFSPRLVQLAQPAMREGQEVGVDAPRESVRRREIALVRRDRGVGHIGVIECLGQLGVRTAAALARQTVAQRVALPDRRDDFVPALVEYRD